MKITPQEQLLHELLAEVQGVKATVADVAERLTRLEAGQPPVSQFLNPSKAKPSKAKTKVASKAKVSSPARRDWKNFKLMAQASGWTQEFYLYLEAWKKAHKLPKKLQGEDYFVAYCAAFREKYVVA